MKLYKERVVFTMEKLKIPQFPEGFLYQTFIFERKRVDEHCALFKVIDASIPLMKNTLSDQYDFLESLVSGKEFQLFIDYHFLVNTNKCVSICRFFTSIIEDKNIECNVLLIFREKNDWVKMIQYTNAEIEKRSNIGNFRITSKYDSTIIINATLGHMVIKPKWNPAQRSYIITANLTYHGKTKIQDRISVKYIAQMFHEYIEKIIPWIPQSNLIYSNELFINDHMNGEDHVIEMELYLFAQLIDNLQLDSIDLRNPILYPINDHMTFTDNKSLLNLLIKGNTIPYTKVSLPLRLDTKLYSMKSIAHDVPSEFITKIVYDVEYVDLMINPRNINDPNRSILYRKIHRFWDLKNPFTIYKRKRFQNAPYSIHAIPVDYIIDGPVAMLDQDNLTTSSGYQVLNHFVSSHSAFQNYEWLIAGSYANNDIPRFIAISISKDIWKQRFKDLSINEKGVTPFCIS